MKNYLSAFLSLALLASLAFGFIQNQQVRGARRQVEKLRTELELVKQQAAQMQQDLKMEAQRAADQSQILRVEYERMRESVARTQQK
jgi:hypothetical protein